jgi:hypothetical protein
MPTTHRNRHACRSRTGKLLVLLVILLPTLFGVAGLMFDGGVMMSKRRDLQHAADAAATAAAFELRLGKGAAVATSAATEILQTGNELPEATVTVRIPPAGGPYAGQPNHVEVIARQSLRSRIMGIFDGVEDRMIEARAVAGVQDVTSGAAIVVLDPDPSAIQFSSVSETLSDVDETVVANAALQQSGVLGQLSAVPLLGPAVTSLVSTKFAEVVPPIINDLVGQAIAAIPAVNAPAIIGGLEIEGLGRLTVDGAILVNNRWGGLDENGDEVGDSSGPPYGVACMPLLPTTNVVAREVRVAGGVDNPDNFAPFGGGSQSPLQANRLPVDDPFAELPTPSLTSDAGNVSTTLHNPADLVRIALPPTTVAPLLDSVKNLLPPLLRPLFASLTTQLSELLSEVVVEPGVYNSITVLAPLGGAFFEPGVYVVRGQNASVGPAVTIIGPVNAQGVLFYVTSSTGFDVATGLPDGGQNANAPPSNLVPTNSPSVVLLPLLPGGSLTGLNDPSSPFHRLLVYQQRQDRRQIVIDVNALLGGSAVSGTVYAKWGHVLLVGGGGVHDLRFVCGTARVLTVGNTTLAPSILFPPAQDVLLLE